MKMLIWRKTQKNSRMTLTTEKRTRQMHLVHLVVSAASHIHYNLLSQRFQKLLLSKGLVSLTGKKLVRDCATHWSSTYLMTSRMLEVHSDLTHVLEDLQWDNLLISDWKLLHAIQEMLEPFAIFTTLVQGEDFTTVSCVIPSIIDLTLHLEEFKSNPGVSEAAELLLTELKRRFRKYTDPGDLEHAPLFLVQAA